MLDYTGMLCPVCKKEFTKNDDIVTCPKCGAPYHRHCYLEKGECIFSDLHESGETWKPTFAEEDKPASVSPYEVKDQDCPRCGVLNNHSSLFCSHCGSPLKIKPDTHNNSQHIQPNTNFSSVYNVTTMHLPLDPMGGVNPIDNMDENISYGEVTKVIQQNTQYYMPIFQKAKDTGSSKFNFSAFLFSGGWLLYRKQYKSGIIFTVSMFILYLGYIFTSLFVSTPRMVDILQSVGESVAESGITYEQIPIISYNCTPMDLFVISLPLLLLVFMLVIMIILGINGNKMYMKHCIKTINFTRQSTQNIEDYNTRIMEKGGVNTSITLCVFVCHLLCSYLPYLFIN